MPSVRLVTSSARSTAALALSAFALVAATGGASYGAAALARNSVGTEQLKTGAVRTIDIRNGAVTSTKIGRSAVGGRQVEDGSLTGADVAANSLTGADISERSLKSPSGSLTYTGTDLLFVGPGGDYSTNNNGSLLPNAAGPFRTRLQLPDGVRPTSVVVTGNDANADTDADIRVFLIRYDPAARGSEGLAFGATSGTPGDTTLTLTAPGDTAPVDNSQYSYGIYVEVVPDSRIDGFTVSYIGAG